MSALGSAQSTSSALKQVAGVVFALGGGTLMVEGGMVPGNAGYLMLVVVAGFAWISIHVRERDRSRAKLFLDAFGLPESEFKKTFGFTDGEVNVLLEDPVARREFTTRIEHALRQFDQLPTKSDNDEQ